MKYSLLIFDQNHFETSQESGTYIYGSLEIHDRQIITPGVLEETGIFIGFSRLNSSATDATFSYYLKDPLTKSEQFDHNSNIFTWGDAFTEHRDAFRVNYFYGFISECLSGYDLESSDGRECFQSCPDGYYAQLSKCLSCHQNCLLCN